jgi:hypothetical protein
MGRENWGFAQHQQQRAVSEKIGAGGLGEQRNQRQSDTGTNLGWERVGREGNLEGAVLSDPSRRQPVTSRASSVSRYLLRTLSSLSGGDLPVPRLDGARPLWPQPTCRPIHFPTPWYLRPCPADQRHCISQSCPPRRGTLRAVGVHRSTCLPLPFFPPLRRPSLSFSLPSPSSLTIFTPSFPISPSFLLPFCSFLPLPLVLPFILHPPSLP